MQSERIALDSNFLVSAVKYKIDLREEIPRVLGKGFQLFSSEKVLEELSAIASGKTRDAPNARVALGLVPGLNVRLAPSTQPVDDWLAENAARDPLVIIATNDRALRKRLKQMRVRTLVVKGRAKLALE